PRWSPCGARVTGGRDPPAAAVASFAAGNEELASRFINKPRVGNRPRRQHADSATPIRPAGRPVSDAPPAIQGAPPTPQGARAAPGRLTLARSRRGAWQLGDDWG